MLTLVPDVAFIPPLAGDDLTMTIVALTEPPAAIVSLDSEVDWVYALNHESCAPGVARVSFQTANNPGPARSANVFIRTDDAKRALKLTQYSGQVVQTQIDEVLEAPMVMEFGIATKFIGKEIAKLPIEAQPIALGLVEALYPMLGGALIAARESYQVLPTPKPLFGNPPIDLSVTAECISRQVTMQLIYLPLAVAEAE